MWSLDDFNAVINEMDERQTLGGPLPRKTVNSVSHGLDSPFGPAMVRASSEDAPAITEEQVFSSSVLDWGSTVKKAGL